MNLPHILAYAFISWFLGTSSEDVQSSVLSERKLTGAMFDNCLL
jgi:hypothetical protein